MKATIEVAKERRRKKGGESRGCERKGEETRGRVKVKVG